MSVAGNVMAEFEFDFTSRIDDVLKAEEVERSFRLGRPFFRGGLILLGSIFVSAGSVILVAQGPNWSGFVWLVVGLTILYFIVARQIVTRSRIKQSASERHLRVAFNDTGIRIDVDQTEEYSRTWDELVQYIVARDGIIFRFTDGVVNLLPARIFSSESEKKEFLNFLKQKR